MVIGLAGDGELVSGEETERGEDADKWEYKSVGTDRIKLIKGSDQ